MQKEHVTFLISMKNSMKKLWPAPIEMGFVDEGLPKSKKWKQCIVNASRWAVCSDITRSMMNRMKDCSVDVSIGRCSDTGVIMKNGDSDEKFQELLDVLCSISNTTRGNEEINEELVIREIEKLGRSDPENKANKQVHWFIDVDMLINLNCSLFEHDFPQNLVTLYVIGELQILHDDYLPAKRVTVLLGNVGIEVKFLLCQADLNELRCEISKEKTYVMSESVATVKIGIEKMKVKLIQNHRFGKSALPIKSLLLVGFLSEIDLSRLGFFCYNSPPEHEMSISVESETANLIFSSIADFMLTESKSYRVALFKFRGSKRRKNMKKKKTSGYAIMTAHENESNESIMTFIRLPKTINYALANTLEYVEKIDEQSIPLPDSSYPQFASPEPRIIKRRLMDIDPLETSESKKEKFEMLAKEYNCLKSRDAFLEFTTAWQKHNGLLEEAVEVELKADDNNN